MNHKDMPKLGDTLSLSEAIRKFNELEHEPLSNVLAPNYMNKVKMREFYWQLREAAEKYGIERPETLDDLRKLTHELTIKRAALANGRDRDRFHLVIEDGDVANCDCPTSSLFGSTASCCKSDPMNCF